MSKVDAFDRERYSSDALAVHAARADQQLRELKRLRAHQRLGADLLCASAAAQRVCINAAFLEVDRWEAYELCSADYIGRWRDWLALPVRQLVQRMCSDAAGWGSAMRQNSPFGVSGYCLSAAPQPVLSDLDPKKQKRFSTSVSYPRAKRRP
ncbi:MAG: hypothetical protein Q8N17_11785 [Burkholderiaceae bacterium]|nr:hypothetical protein [Desulfobacterales bacterium]MDP3136996.1 hypothetical protein [Burkholderiaceae bacterium]